MDEKAKLIKQLQEDDERQRLIAELQAHDNNGKSDGLPEGLFAPEKRVVVHNQSTGMQAAAGLMGLSNTLGINKAIQTVAPQEFGDNLVEQTKAAKEEYAPAYNLGKNTARALPALVVPAAALGTQAAVQGGGGVVQELTDVTSDGSDAVKRAALTGTFDAATTLGGGLLLNKTLPAASKALTQSAPAQNLTKKMVSGLQSGLKRLGFDADEIRKASNALKKGEATDSNPLLQLKLLYERGVLKGAKSTVDAANAVDEVIVKNGGEVEKILSSMEGVVAPKSASPLEALNWDKDLVRISRAKLMDTAKSTLEKLGLDGLLDESGAIRALTVPEAQSAKKVLDAFSNFEVGNDLAKMQQHVIKTIGSHLRDAIEDASPAIGDLNKVSHAALNLQQKLIKLENKGLDIGKSPARQILSNVASSPLLSMGAGAGVGGMVAPYLGMERSQGVALGLGIGAGVKYANTPKSLQSSLSPLNARPIAIPRTLEGLSRFLSDPNVQKMIPPAMMPVLRQFEALPPEEAYRVAATVAIPQLESVGIAFEPPASGFPSEFNGKVHTVEDKIAAGAKLDSMRDTMGILKWGSAKNALNATGSLEGLQSANAAQSPDELDDSYIEKTVDGRKLVYPGSGGNFVEFHEDGTVVSKEDMDAMKMRLKNGP